MLAWPYGFPQVMSSYNFDRTNDAQGPPGSNGVTSSPIINAWVFIRTIYLSYYLNVLAFIAINNDDFGMDVTIQTGLPSGTYCDVNSGYKQNNSCTGRTVTVNGDGTARIQITYYNEDPVIAIHINSKLVMLIDKR